MDVPLKCYKNANDRFCYQGDGAQSTAVRVLGGGKFIIEGKTYEETYLAADFVSVTLLKMLCGSPDCPDAAACATGGDCGC